MESLVEKLIQADKTPKILAKEKRIFAKKTGELLKNSQILSIYNQLLKNRKIEKNPALENLLRLKKIRSLSGIVPVAVLTKPYPCPGRCIYCPTENNIPKSYLSNEPAVMRAVRVNFDPYLQVKNRLDQLEHTGHKTNKVELIVMGGCFNILASSYQIAFLSKCYASCNNMPKTKKANFKILSYLQKKNEKAKSRIVGLTLETRPDLINKNSITAFRKFGCTRVEIGVQTTNNKVLKICQRGHNYQTTVKATRMLKDHGFKVCYHLMPNLPSSTLKIDLAMFKTIFTDPRYMPDMIKIYPCVVLKEAALYRKYKQGKFKPYKDRELIELLIQIKQLVPLWVRINRLGRDIPATSIVGGNKISNIRQVLKREMQNKKLSCQCIRCREVRRGSAAKNIFLRKTILNTNGGKEYFLEFVDNKNTLYSMLRLRLPKNNPKFVFPALSNSAIVRELHTYGEALEIKEKKASAFQHHGLGKKLLQEAENIAKKEGYQKIAVISGVGAREYYQKLGYQLQSTYMFKKL